MDLNRVAIFVRVVEEGGFTAAARALGLPKSSVSRAVALLERELGVRLLLRSTRAIALTEAGAAFHLRASRGLLEVEEAREAMIDLEADLRGTVRITAPVDAGAWLIAPVIAAFVCEHPGVLVDVVLTGRVVDLVEEGFDLAVRAGEVRDESLVARKLHAVRLAVYGSPAYLEKHGTPRTVRALAAHRAVLFRARGGRATWTLRHARGEETVEVSGSVDADDLAFVLHAVAAGAGLGLVPTFAAGRAETAGLVRVLPRHEALGGELLLVHPGGRYVPRRVAALRDFLFAELAGPARRSR